MNYELLVDELLETIKALRKKLDDSRYNCKYWYKQTEELQEKLQGLQPDYEQLQSENTNLLLHRNSLQAENNKLILERDQLRSELNPLQTKYDVLQSDYNKVQENWYLAQSVIADLQLKNDEKRQLLKDRGVIIDDSIVREEPK